MTLRVNVFSFMHPQVYGGGGEIVSRALLDTARTLGHDVRISSVRPHREEQHAEPDLVLFIDIHNFGHTWRAFGAWRGFSQSTLRAAASQTPFVHISNAYVDVCNLPYLPCSGQRAWDTCSVKPAMPWSRRRVLLRDGSTDCSASHASRRWLYEEAALNVYVSPLHQRVTESLLRLDNGPPSYVLPPMIDTSRFYNRGIERDIDYLFVGVISEAKGLDAMRKHYADKNIWLVGRVSPDVRLDFGRHVPHVAYDEVPLYMNRAKNFVFLPRWPEPQGRVVAEAALCGCNIIGNENVGALSFDMDLSDAANYNGVEAGFWNRVEGIFK
jgi:glycosyltransferase involved in cell wall biosynthesis